jgi:hypothetical protein
LSSVLGSAASPHPSFSKEQPVDRNVLLESELDQEIGVRCGAALVTVDVLLNTPRSRANCRWDRLPRTCANRSGSFLLFRSTAALAMVDILLMIAIAWIPDDRAPPDRAGDSPGAVAFLFGRVPLVYGTRAPVGAVIRLRHPFVSGRLHCRRILGNLAGLQQLQSCAFRCRRESFSESATPQRLRRQRAPPRSFRKPTGGFFRCVSPGENWSGAVCGRRVVDGYDPAPIG